MDVFYSARRAKLICTMSDQISDRRIKRDKIRALGADPYGERFTGLTQHADIRTAAEQIAIEPGQILEPPSATFRAAGRVGLYRDIGSLIFMTVRDRTGELQYGISKKMVGEGWPVAKLIDLGDVVGGEGRLGRTKTGELTLWLSSFKLLSKAVRPPPEKWHGLTDVELRYRKRYVDLFANPESRDIFVQRSRIIDYARKVLQQRGFIEVETPVLQPIYGGAAARPFRTHHNTLDLDLYLRISPELYLKRCLVGGLERVFELARCFRNEGISPRHNPEFTMLELYQAYGDYHDMMDICEAIIGGAARDVIGSTRIKFDQHEIDYATPWRRVRYGDLLHEHAGVDMNDHAAVLAKAKEIGILAKLQKAQAALNAGVDPAKLSAPGMEQQPMPTPAGAGGAAATLHVDHVLLVNALFEELVEHHLINPTFVIDYPAPLCPLTKRHPDDPSLALRFELYINGMEMGNAYSELNDPDIQRENLAGQVEGEGDETMRVMDEDFVESLEYGMPPAGGLGIGIDRLVMLLTGSTSIRDVILFPLQRPRE
jgi:lysyl-tRNA synthetase, class II